MISVKCRHKWVAMEDGTNDKLCVKCRKFAMQAAFTFNAEDGIRIGESIAEGFAKGFESTFDSEGRIDEVGELLRRETEKDMMKATRSKGAI